MIERANQRLFRLGQHRHLQYWLLLGIMLLTAGLRLFRLGAWSFWIDEIFTLNRSKNVIMLLTSWPPVLPPLSVVLTHFVVDTLGTGEWAARLTSTLIGIASIPLLYFPVRRLFSSSVGLITVLLLAVSPWHLFWSQNARFYTSLLLFYTVTAFVLYIGYEEEKLPYLVLAVPLLFLTLGERLTGLFLVPVIVVYLLVMQMGKFAGPRRLAWGNLAPIVLLVLGIGVYDGYRYVTTGYSLVVSSFETFFGQQIDDPFRLLTFIVSNLGVPVMILAMFGAVYLVRQRDSAGLYVALGAAVPFLLSIALSPFVFVKDRYVFASLVQWLILAAVAVQALWQMLPMKGRLLAVGVLCLLVGDGLWQDMQYFTINNGHRRDWRGAFALVEAQRGPTDKVASSWQQLGTHYLDDEVIWMGEVTLEAIRADGQVYWFVADSESVWVTGSIWPWVQSAAELIDKRSLRVPEDMTLWIYRYDPEALLVKDKP